MINSRDKGCRGEREAARMLSKYRPACRSQQHCGKGGDADIKTDCPIHWEVKYVERISVYSAVEQAVSDSAASGRPPAVIHRRNGKPWVVIVPFDRLDDFVSALHPYLEGSDGK